jgi:hypothetical protein
MAAAKADVDPRTALKMIQGGRVRGRVAERIRKALAELGCEVSHV